MITKNCKVCDNQFDVYPSRSDAQFCSRDCYLGSNHNPNEEKKVEVECEWCSSEFERIPSLSERTERNFCGYDCMYRWRSENWAGENSPTWKGGWSKYMGSNWEEARKDVLERDEVCQVCGHDGSDYRLSPHHIVPRRLFEQWGKAVEHSNKRSNLVLVCNKCHSKVEHGKVDCPTPWGDSA